MIRIGLTGCIASGKSTVLQMLRERQIPVLDADIMAREAVALGTPALQRIFETFGEKMRQQDGSLNRRALGSLIFADKQARETLNQIVHPAVFELMHQQFTALEESGEKIAVADIPLLFETGYDSQMDQNWLVICDDATRFKRMMRRDGLTADEAFQRMGSQMPQDEKKKRTVHWIDNSGDLAHTRQQVESLLQTILPAF